MATTINYKRGTVADFASLVSLGFDLASPFRSTVPLLAFWTDFDARLAEFGERLKLPFEGDVVIDFEHTVAPPQGSGKASHTDLMVLGRACPIAIEAKYTEPKYPTVSRWLGAPASENKMLVLQGWLDLINKAADSNLTSDQVQGSTYQLIHRTASACTPRADRRAVVYHYFDPVERRLEEYRHHLQALSALVAAPSRLSFVLYVSVIQKTTAYAQLQANWLRQGKPDVSAQVRKLLIDHSVGTFSEPIIWTF